MLMVLFTTYSILTSVKVNILVSDALIERVQICIASRAKNVQVIGTGEDAEVFFPVLLEVLRE